MRNEENFHLFRILDEVSKNTDLTQRNLSQRLGVALGLTNLYVRRLAKRGWIKVVNLKPNRLRYELTPSGIAQKTTMAFQYIQDSYVFYREARKSLTHTFASLRSAGARSVVLYGVGDLAEIALLSLQEAQLDLSAIVGDVRKQQFLCGKPVLPRDSLKSLSYDRLIVIGQEGMDIGAVASELGIEESKIVRVGV